MTGSTSTRIAFYTWGGHGRVRAAEFCWSEETGVTLTLLHPAKGDLAQTFYDEGFVFERERRMVRREEGATFMRALLQPWNMSYYAFVDESDHLSPNHVLGSILAGAVGDALGAPVEFLGIEMIRERFGPQGTVDYERAYGGQGQITDDTQMTLFTMDGLIRAHLTKRLHGKDNLVPMMQRAYQHWFHTQGVPWERANGGFASGLEPGGWLIRNRELFHRRAPGSTVMAALKAFADGGVSPSPDRPGNDSKGCGAVMRAAPFAVWSNDPDEVFTAAALAGALTHGHPSGYLSAGALAVIVQRILAGANLFAAVDAARAELARWPRYEETDRALAAAVELAEHGRPSPEQIAERLGGGWVGEEALAIGVCAALVATDLADGLRLAVNHSGDSDSTGAICGNILGAQLGVTAIPPNWLAELELRAVIEELTLDLILEFSPMAPSEPWWTSRYPALGAD